MPTKLELMQEAYNRGILPKDKASLYEEAVRRGILKNDDIDTSPVKMAQTVMVTDPQGRQDSRTIKQGEEIPEAKYPGYRVSVYPSDEETAAAASGVDTRTGSTVGRYEQSWMPESQKAVYVKEQLQKKLGKDTQVRIGEAGRLEFVNPDTNRWTTFDEYGFGVGDLKDMFGEALPLIFDVIGSVGGLVLGKGSAAIEAASSAVGTGIGEDLRLNIGKGLGYHDLSQEEIALESTNKAGVAAAATLAGRGVVSAGHRLKYGKQILSDDAGEIVLKDSEEANKAIDIINRNISGKYEVSPTLGARSGADPVLDIEATIQKGSYNADNATALRMQQKESQLGLSEYFDVSTGKAIRTKLDPSTPELNPALETTGRAVKEKVTDQTQARIAKQEAYAKTQTDAAMKETALLPELDKAAAGKDAREALQAQLDVIAGTKANKKLGIEASPGLEEIAWNKYKTTAGYRNETDLSNVKIPRNKDIDDVVSQMARESRHAIYGQEGKNKKVLLNSRLVPNEEDAITIVDKDGNPLITVNKGDDSYDLIHVQRAISYLKKQSRVSRKEVSGVEPDVADIYRQITALTRARDEYLLKNNPKLLRQIEDAEAITARKHEVFDKGVVGKILKKDGNNYVLDDEGVFMKVFSVNNAGAAREYASVLSSDPRAMQAARNNILALYNATVVKNGIPDRKLHENFMKKYGETAKVFFNGTEGKQIEKLGGLSYIVERHAKKLDLFEKKFKETFKGKISSFSPTEMTNAFFKNPTRDASTAGLTSKEVSRLENYLKMYGKDELKSYKETVAYEIRRRSVNKDGYFDPTKLRNLLESTGDIDPRQAGKISRLFGRKYADDLRAIISVSEMVGKKGVPNQKAQQPGYVTAWKIITGPLHRTSRFATHVGGIDVKRSDMAILKAIKNPDQLRALVASRGARRTQKQTAAILSSLGALSLMAEQP